MSSTDMKNPFTVQTPEDIEAQEALQLFVDVFTDFHKIRDRGHCMLNGARGCGKSMMFRLLQPDCQQLIRQVKLNELPFYSVLVSIKNTVLNLTDLRRLADGHVNVLLNEHFLTMFVASRMFLALAKTEIAGNAATRKAVAEFYKAFVTGLERCGFSDKLAPLPKDATIQRVFEHLKTTCDDLYCLVINYIRCLSFFSGTLPPYRGPLCGYLDFLLPLCTKLKELEFMPRGPLYLLMDDADYLNLVQTKILNSWVSTRTSATVSIKISTQLKYKTFQTVSGAFIDSPHDFSEINISDIYTGSKGTYLRRVEEIVDKRLKASGIQRDPKQFFPVDAEQEAEIEKIKEQLRNDWPITGKGHSASDDVVRYARPTFIANLKGPRKSGSTYSYAGFEQLVHISSGLIRYFLEPAALMFSEEVSLSHHPQVTEIRPGIQDKIIREEAERLMFNEFEKIFRDDASDTEEAKEQRRLDKKAKLHNLIKALGGAFHLKLISSDSAERRVFSVAISGNPEPDLIEIFELGVQFGYFHRSTIGNKDGTGRTPLYVLTRRLAPYFNLDPTSFAGYLFVTNERIKEAIAFPDRFLRKVKEKGADAAFASEQLPLFDSQGG
jgi:hypothetical protein